MEMGEGFLIIGTCFREKFLMKIVVICIYLIVFVCFLQVNGSVVNICADKSSLIFLLLIFVQTDMYECFCC